MPASTLDPVNVALRNALSSDSANDVLNSKFCGSSRQILNTNIEFECIDNYQNTLLTNLKSKYTLLHANKTSPTTTATTTITTTTSNASGKKSEIGVATEETLAKPQRVLYSLDSIQLGWRKSDWGVGAGMLNMGNTCYLNSTLQALFHVPALVNWLLSDKQHMLQCEESGGGQGGCVICAISKTLQASQQKNTNAFRPWSVYSKLRVISRHLVPGRQEDAHEFLRYLVEAMERAYLQRFRNLGTLDTRSKETTPLNQILGGYLRSTVRCLECEHVSTTFQHFQDLLLDIRKVNTLDEALDLYFAREKLDDLAYHCENCRKKVLATKQFSLERAPMVLCVQLKRFSVTNNKITKHVSFRQRLELTRFARRKPNVPLVYHLVAVVTHMGQTVSCGHYTAVAQAPCGNFYLFDDGMVRPVSQQTVFNTNAYIMLFELEQRTQTTTSTTTTSKLIYDVNNVDSSSLKDTKDLKMVTNGVNNNINNNNGTVSSTSYLNGSCSQNGNGTKRMNGLKKYPDSNSDSDEITSNSNSNYKSNSVPITNGNGNEIQKPAQTKLVPYDADDDSTTGTDESSAKYSSTPRAANGSWQVTSNSFRGPSLKGQTGWNRNINNNNSNNNDTVTKLMGMSHEGYGTPVTTWVGSRSVLNRDVANERRDIRKRALSDSNLDHRQSKHTKYGSNHNSYNNMEKSNPGYNPFQEYSTSRRWQNDTHYYRSYYNNNNNRHRYQRRGNYHNNRYRDKFRH